MIVFEIRDKINGSALISLPGLLGLMPRLPVVVWAFRQVSDIRYPLPFGIDVNVFEKLTQSLSRGFMVRSDDFDQFLKADFQLVDGSIDAYSAMNLDEPIFTLECIDSSYWEIATNSQKVAELFEGVGLRRRM